MVYLIIGHKGSGKTKLLVDRVNAAVEKSNGNVCLLYTSFSALFYFLGLFSLSALSYSLTAMVFSAVGTVFEGVVDVYKRQL